MFALCLSVLVLAASASRLRKRNLETYPNTGIVWENTFVAPDEAHWESSCMTSTGQVVYGIVDASSPANYQFYKSQTYGYTFAGLNSTRFWNVDLIAVTCDSTGQYVAVATSGSGGIFVSTDYGLTFGAANINLAGGFKSIASSEVSGGVWKIIASSQTAKLYQSLDTGATWDNVAGIACRASDGAHWEAVTANADYSYVTANCQNTLTQSSTIFYTRTSGATWFSNDFSGMLSSYSAASKNTGSYVLVGSGVVNDTRLWRSTNGAKDWSNATFLHYPYPYNAFYGYHGMAIDYTGQYQGVWGQFNMTYDVPWTNTDWAVFFYSEDYGATFDYVANNNDVRYLLVTTCNTNNNGSKWFSGDLDWDPVYGHRANVNRRRH